MDSIVPKGYKQTKVGVIPEEWEEYLFSNIFIFSTGKNIKQNEASPKFSIPCVRYGELYHMYNEIITKVINKTNLDKSELLFSKGNEILLPSAGEDPIKEGIYSQEYMAYYINHKLKRKIASLAKDSSISNVYNSDLKNIKVPLPSLKEQLKKGFMQKLFSGEVRI